MSRAECLDAVKQSVLPHLFRHAFLLSGVGRGNNFPRAGKFFHLSRVRFACEWQAILIFAQLAPL